jgi:DNA-binding SARP family transcriptional activator/TolB-like protein
MLTVRMLGGIGLTAGDGREVDAVLRQPKRMALLAYLAMPRPGTWHRRDSLVAMFWPELDQSRARSSLRGALFTLRKELEDGAVRTRGDDEVSLDPDLVATDVAAMADDIANGRHAAAVDHYRGEFLPSLYVPDAEGFEEWLERERQRLQGLARKAVAALSASREQSGDVAGAIDASRRSVELDPDDEKAARRLIALLDANGERAHALAAYERFRKRVSEQFGVTPSAETLALVDGVRARERGRSTSAPATTADARTTSPAEPAVAPLATPAPGAPELARRRPSRWRRWPAFAALLIAVAAIAVIRGRRDAPAPVARRLVVLPMENQTGDAQLDYIASGLAEGVSRRLEGIGGLTVRSGARSEWPAATRHDLQAIGRQFGSTLLLRMSLARVADSLTARASVVDLATRGERTIAEHRFTVDELRSTESVLAAAVAGAIYRVPLPQVTSEPVRAIRPDSWRLMLEGWHQLLAVRNVPAAKRLFLEATNADPSNARAWAGLSSTWAAQAVTDQVPPSEGYERAEAAASRALALDSLQGTAWANLAIVRAIRYRSLAIGTELMRKAIAADPSNPEVFLVASSLYRNAWRWEEALDAIRVARQLDPLTPYYLDREATTALCAGRPDEALRLYERELMMSPTDRDAQRGRTRTLAMLRRFDDAIAAWRADALANGNTQLAEFLGTARGESGYWDAVHREGRRRLATLEDGSKRGWVSPVSLMQQRFAAGDIERGFQDLEALAVEPSSPLYRLRCNQYYDEVRRQPRFEAIVKQVGALPPG